MTKDSDSSSNVSVNTVSTLDEEDPLALSPSSQNEAQCGQISVRMVGSNSESET